MHHMTEVLMEDEALRRLTVMTSNSRMQHFFLLWQKNIDFSKNESRLRSTSIIYLEPLLFPRGDCREPLSLNTTSNTTTQLEFSIKLFLEPL